jgi:hypothetical protein
LGLKGNRWSVEEKKRESETIVPLRVTLIDISYRIPANPIIGQSIIPINSGLPVRFPFTVCS